MIDIDFVVRNPWSKAGFTPLRDWVGRIPFVSRKRWEVQVYRYAPDILGFRLDLEFRGVDHAGPSLHLICWGYTVALSIYDIRHWNDETNDWEK